MEHPDDYSSGLAGAVRNSLSPDACRLIAARLQGQPDPKPQDFETDETPNLELNWFANFLNELAPS